MNLYIKDKFVQLLPKRYKKFSNLKGPISVAISLYRKVKINILILTLSFYKYEDFYFFIFYFYCRTLIDKLCRVCNMHDAPSNYRLDMLASIRKKSTLKENSIIFIYILLGDILFYTG